MFPTYHATSVGRRDAHLRSRDKYTRRVGAIEFTEQRRSHSYAGVEFHSSRPRVSLTRDARWWRRRRRRWRLWLRQRRQRHGRQRRRTPCSRKRSQFTTWILRCCSLARSRAYTRTQNVRTQRVRMHAPQNALDTYAVNTRSRRRERWNFRRESVD